MVEGADAMAKAANVELIGWRLVGGGLGTGMVRGDGAAVRTATAAGAASAARSGDLVGSHVIARPHEDLGVVLPNFDSA